MEKNIEKLAIEERRAYYRAWRAKNKEKIKSYNHMFWKKRAMQKKEGGEQIK
jgi:hypothetical protein